MLRNCTILGMWKWAHVNVGRSVPFLCQVSSHVAIKRRRKAISAILQWDCLSALQIFVPDLAHGKPNIHTTMSGKRRGPFKLNGQRLQICHIQNRQIWFFFWLEIKGNITALPTGGACMHCRSVFKEPKLISSSVFVLLSMETAAPWNDAIIISFFFFTCAGFIEVSLQQQWLCLQRMLITLVWSHTDRARTRMGLICNSSSDHVCNTIWLIYYSFPDYSFHIEMVKISEKLHDRVKGPVLFSNNNSFKRNIFYRRL